MKRISWSDYESMQLQEVVLRAFGYTQEQVDSILNGDRVVIERNGCKYRVDDYCDAVALATDYVNATDIPLLIAKALVSFTPTFENISGELMQGYVECVGASDGELQMITLYKKPFDGDKA